MTRNHRRAHRLIWPALAAAIAFAFVTALVLRGPAANVEIPPAQETRR